jgi:hypothetical protein
MSPWMVWPTFSSTLILAISWVMKASVLASVIAAGLAAAGHWSGWAMVDGLDWAKAATPARLVEATRAEIRRRRERRSFNTFEKRPVRLERGRNCAAKNRRDGENIVAPEFGEPPMKGIQSRRRRRGLTKRVVPTDGSALERDGSEFRWASLAVGRARGLWCSLP